MKTLERVDVGSLKAKVTMDSAKLANACSRELGYTPLVKKLQTDLDRNKFFNRLSKIGIMPFTDESVEFYKQEMLVSGKRRAWNSFFLAAILFCLFVNLHKSLKFEAEREAKKSGKKSELSNVTNLVMIVTVFLTIFVGFLAAIPVVICCGFSLASLWMATLISATLVVGFRTLLWPFKRVEDLIIRTCYRFGDNVGVPSWDMSALSDYKRPIPQRVLGNALLIQEEFGSEVKLKVDEFTLAAIPWDPFLVIEWNGQDFFVDVWDEPKFQMNL